MNHRAIDAGATAFVKIDVPAAWADAEDNAEVERLEGRPELVKQVREIMEPVGRMAGDSLPVSVFVDHADGQFEQGAAAYEKRGVSVSVAKWDADKVHPSATSCSFVCPHACIRPFAPDRRGGRRRPRGHGRAAHEGQAQGRCKYTLAISPLDCMGCGVCVKACPADALTMVGVEDEMARAGRVRVLREQDRRQARDRGHHAASDSQFKPAAARVLRRLRRLRPDGLRPPDHPALRRPYVHLQRHRLLFHLGRSGCYQPVHGQQAGSRPRMVQQPVRGQRRARHGHEAGL